jgi:hypothetical protein
MKTKICLGLLGVMLVLSGCVNTVGGGHTAGMPFVKDRVKGSYERSVDQVYEAAKDVVKLNGTLIRESILHTETNDVKTVEGKVNQRDVWVLVAPVDPKVTEVTVQARTSGGNADLDVAHEVEKQIALKLVH